jgi:bifunctional enzyme CysN/CysC
MATAAQAAHFAAVRTRHENAPALRDREHDVRLALDGIVHVLTCGSVDDGKSTLIGRLLWDAATLHDDQRAMLARSAGADGVPDFSLLVDGLLAEREQGITIDIAWRYVDTAARRLVVIDSPGHEQYTRNMASGASHADLAVMLVDARHGVKPQTRRHAAILDLVGVRHVVLAVNKMDLVGWSEDRFREVEAGFAALAAPLGFRSARAIPLSARHGDNVAGLSGNMPWYRGTTLIDEIDATPSRRQADTAPFRLPVQSVVRAGDFRGLAGTVVSGGLSVGDRIVDVLSGRAASVSRIVTMDGDLGRAGSGRAVVVGLDRDLDIARGAILAREGEGPRLASTIAVRLVWLADQPLSMLPRLVLRTATDEVPLSEIDVHSRFDLTTARESPASTADTNEIVTATLSLSRPVAIDRFAHIPATGAILLIDAMSGATVAGGVVTSAESAPRATAGPEPFRLTRAALQQQLCAGLSPSDPEFRRRAEAAAALLRSAGVAAAWDDEHDA